GAHDNGSRRGGSLRGERGIGTPGEDDVRLEVDQTVRQLRISFIAPTGVAVLEPHVLALDIAEGIKSMSKSIDVRPCCNRQDTDGDESLRLLRTRRERPRRRCATDQGDEFSSPHDALRPRTAPYHITKLNLRCASQQKLAAHWTLRVKSGALTSRAMSASFQLRT